MAIEKAADNQGRQYRNGESCKDDSGFPAESAFPDPKQAFPARSMPIFCCALRHEL
jgi:hypothetical protein